MIKKKIVKWVTNSSKEEEKRMIKIRRIEGEILDSRINKQYRDLGEFVYKSFKRNRELSVQSVKLNNYLSEIKKLLFEKKKMEKQ